MADHASIAAPGKGSMRETVSSGEWDIRVELAACYRLMAHFGLTDLIYNHITARVPGDEHHFLINPYGLLYEEVTASSLHKIDTSGNIVLRGHADLNVNPAGFVIHSAVHMGRDDAGCVIHTHSRAATAVSAMKCGILPISQSAMMFFEQVSYHPFEGAAVNLDERQRLVSDLGSNDVMVLHNHGTLMVGRSVRHAFLMAYQFENACRIQVDTMAAADIILAPRETSIQVREAARHPRYANDLSLEWNAMLRLLDRVHPNYAS